MLCHYEPGSNRQISLIPRPEYNLRSADLIYIFFTVHVDSDLCTKFRVFFYEWSLINRQITQERDFYYQKKLKIHERNLQNRKRRTIAYLQYD